MQQTGIPQAAATIAAVFFIGTTAHATDRDAELASSPARDWNGIYVGVSGGYVDGGGSVSLADPYGYVLGNSDPAQPSLGSLGSSGGLGGFTAGYNLQLGRGWIAGVEADLSFVGLRADGADEFIDPSAEAFGSDFSHELDWLGTLRARLGYLPMDRLLVYGTGGLAFARTTSSASVINNNPNAVDGYLNPGEFEVYCSLGEPCVSGSSSGWSAGWALGAGAEYSLTSNVSFKVEYLHADLGSRSVDLSRVDPAGFGDPWPSAEFSSKLNIVRLGINYRF